MKQYGEIFFNQEYFSSDVMQEKVLKVKEIISDVPADELCAIAMERTPLLLACIAAFLELHRPFVLMDKTVPPKRMEYICEEAKIKHIIDDEFLTSHWEVEGKSTFNKIENDIAYIIYTSGSTGNPKGVAIPYRALNNLLEIAKEQLEFREGVKITSFANASFDMFILEGVCAFLLGMTLILATEDEQKNPRLADKLIREYEVDVVEMTPSRLQTILFVDPELLCMEKTKKIMLGGEALPLSILHTLQKYTTAKIYNMYGPTESTVWASMADLTDKTKVTLGKALKNIHIFLLDDQNCIIRSQDRIGEIAISGCSLAKGYYNNSYLTALQFTPLKELNGEIAYFTGDLGKIDSEGNIEFWGRKDSQIKLHGYRIELIEIEQGLVEMPGIDMAAVIQEEAGLIACYTGIREIEEDKIKKFLKD